MRFTRQCGTKFNCAYANAASARNEAPDVGVSTLEFHELSHETKFGEALTNQYPVTPTLSLPREAGTGSAGRRMSDAVGAPFDCSIPQGGCQWTLLHLAKDLESSEGGAG
jgi:hypothetical protein